MPLPQNVHIVHATVSDVPTVSQNWSLAFLTDSHTQLKTLINGTDGFEDSSWLVDLVDHPRVDFLVAKEITVGTDGAETERLIGHALFGRTRFYDDPLADNFPEGLKWPPPPAPPPLPQRSPLSVADLKNLTNTSREDWEAYFSPDKRRCRYIIGVVVHPSYQGKGIGTELLKWVTKKCDEEGVYCWVQSSMGATKGYEKVGFVQVGQLELELDLFSEGRKRPDGSEWGPYVWPYMRRDPEHKPSN